MCVFTIYYYKIIVVLLKAGVASTKACRVRRSMNMRSRSRWKYAYKLSTNDRDCDNRRACDLSATCESQSASTATTVLKLGHSFARACYSSD